jgi:predicted AAA+ superfamily ATPase
MINRLQINEIERNLFKGKILIVYGARQIGKTSLCKQILTKYADQGMQTKYFNCELSETQEILNTRSLAKLKSLIGIYDLVVLDEAQKIPEIGEILKILVDNLPNTQVITTGSSSFELANYTGEPLVGRSRKILMYPISSLEIIKKYDVNYLRENIYTFVQFGMLPKVLTLDTRIDKIEELKQITEGYLYKDLFKLEEVRKPALLEKLIKILAHQVGSEVSSGSIANALQVSPITIDRYLDILQKAFMIYKLPPYFKNLQSEIKNKPKYYFYDTGVLNTLLQNNYNLEASDKYLGGIWENFVVMEKIKQNNLLKSRHQFYYWRNKGGAEVDLVIKTANGLKACEIKYNSNQKAKLSKSFQEAYNPLSFEIINPVNFWQGTIVESGSIAESYLK